MRIIDRARTIPPRLLKCGAWIRRHTKIAVRIKFRNPTPFDRADLQLIARGLILAIVITVSVEWAAATAGLAVRTFLFAAGFR